LRLRWNWERIAEAFSGAMPAVAEGMSYSRSRAGGVVSRGGEVGGDSYGCLLDLDRYLLARPPPRMLAARDAWLWGSIRD
jgi:hypothetical protein